MTLPLGLHQPAAALEDARARSQQFFHGYNGTHCHSSIGFMTPESVHYGRAQTLFKQRADILNIAFPTQTVSRDEPLNCPSANRRLN